MIRNKEPKIIIVMIIPTLTHWTGGLKLVAQWQLLSNRIVWFGGLLEISMDIR